MRDIDEFGNAGDRIEEGSVVRVRNLDRDEDVMKAARGQTEPIVVTSFTVMEVEAERLLQEPSMAVSSRAGLPAPEGSPGFPR